MGINVIVFSGNCGADMETRVTPNGKTIGQVNVPCKSGWGDNEKTSWISCKMFGDRAEKIAPYLTKGTQVTVSGRFELDQWEKDGVKHSRPVCIVNDIQFSRTESAGGGGSARPSAKPDGGQGAGGPSQSSGGGMGDFEDDVPFAAIGREHQS